ncbi:PE-PPE domain-containing protein [Mycobacterium sp. OAE908]|uniref:PE-PPE domain-containing protein n=1 Tax=Mycobacterium sp. OAE908 TaxID=2817899 RepID=UPI001AEABD55
MSTGKSIGRVGALALALGVGFAPVSAQGVAVAESQETTALIVCGTACPTPDKYFVESAMNQYIVPTHPGQTITPDAVTIPGELWPITGLLRLIGFVTGDPRIFGPGGAVWPDEPWWKLSGLFDLIADQSVQGGVVDLEARMAEHGNDHLVIFGDSQGAFVVNKEKRRLAAQYPPGTAAPDISFVLVSDPNVPNGGLASRFPGLPTVILGTFDGPEPTNTQFHTDVITFQYDGGSDLPLYPLNVIADLNAVLGFFYVHTRPFDYSLPADPTTSPAYQGTHGDSSYYFFPTEHLPLFAPLRQLGVPEPLIDVVEPFFRSIVELGYDRSIPPWEPTPARLIPPLNPAKVTSDLVSAVGEGINNALALVGSPARSSSPAPGPVQGLRTTKTMTVADTHAGAADGQMSTDTDTSTKAVSDTAKPVEPSTDQTAAIAPEPAATPRHVVRHSLGPDEQKATPPKRGKKAVKAESSSAASTSANSPSAEGLSSGDNSSGVHADSSESST